VSLRRLRNPVLYRRLAARYAPPPSSELVRFLRSTDFYTEVRRFARRVLQLLEG
jgi:hypothetical protein